jgi:hypothetical protein
MKLEARGSGYAKARRGGKSECISISGQGQAMGNIYTTSILHEWNGES